MQTTSAFDTTKIRPEISAYVFAYPLPIPRWNYYLRGVRWNRVEDDIQDEDGLQMKMTLKLTRLHAID